MKKEVNNLFDIQHNTSDFNITFHMKQVIATSMLTVFLIPENKKRMEELVGIELSPFELKEVMIGNLFSDIVNEYLSKPMGIDEEAYQ